MAPSVNRAVRGLDSGSPADALFVNAPLRDYDLRPRVNDFTLPVLGMGYIATYARANGFNVGVLDAEALGLGITETIELVNQVAPRWVGLNLLAPTYDLSARISTGIDAGILVMVGGHQAKAMPQEVLRDKRFGRIAALVLGEAETRVAELLLDVDSRRHLPGVMWLNNEGRVQTGTGPRELLAPAIDALPFVDRRFFVADPYDSGDGGIESSLVGARGCPYDCSFCGAAVSANPDVTIRMRSPANILAEMDALSKAFGVTAFRFVDDLFLGHPRFIDSCIHAFNDQGVGDRFVWDATGRINVLDRCSDRTLDALAGTGCREVALGIESGSERLLAYMDKHITPEMTTRVVERLTSRGIGVKGYFILGFPTESRRELDATVTLVRDLWARADRLPGTFRASIFEFRPYPGTPEWHRLLASGRYQPAQLLDYTAVDLTNGGVDQAMLERDEFNFSVGIQFGDVPLDYLRARLVELTEEQYARRSRKRP